MPSAHTLHASAAPVRPVLGQGNVLVSSLYLPHIVPLSAQKLAPSVVTRKHDLHRTATYTRNAHHQDPLAHPAAYS